MSDDSLLDFLTDRFDKLESKVDDLAAVNARLAGHDEDIREIKASVIRLEDKLDGRPARTWTILGGVACMASAFIYLAVHFVK